MRARARFGVLLVLAALFGGGCYSGSIEHDGNYKFGRDVPESERDAVRAGVEAMEQWLASAGNVRLKRLSVEVDSNINTLVSRYTYYHANEDPELVAQWFVSGGAVASGDVVYIYAGPEWRDYEDWQKSLIAAHEVFHVAQFGFLYDDWFLREQEAGDYPPDWLVEGGADYAAARAIAAAGILDFEHIRAQTERHAHSYPLSLASVTAAEGDSAGGQAAPYAVGFLAVEQLATLNGERALFDFWDALASQGSWRASFASAYGRSVESFVLEFDHGRADDPIPPGGIRGHLTREDGAPVPGATVVACDTSTFDCMTTWTADDGSFVIALEPGKYEVYYRVATRKSSEQGRFTRSGERVELIEIASEMVEGLEGRSKKPL